MKKNNLFKPLFSALLAFAIIIACFSVFKGPYFIVVKYYYTNGYFKQKTGNLKEAIADFTEAISYDKTHKNSYISRGSAYMDLKKYKEAIADYTTAINLDPNDAKPYAYRGRGYYEIGKAKLSLQDYSAAINLDNTFAYAYSNRSLLLYTVLHQYDASCVDLKKAAELGDEDAKGYLKDGYCD